MIYILDVVKPIINKHIIYYLIDHTVPNKNKKLFKIMKTIYILKQTNFTYTTYNNYLQ